MYNKHAEVTPSDDKAFAYMLLLPLANFKNTLSYWEFDTVSVGKFYNKALCVQKAGIWD